MRVDLSQKSKEELIFILKLRYKTALKNEKTVILDEFVKITEYHRKHAIRLLRGINHMNSGASNLKGRRIYGEAVREAITVLWEASDRICSKRLKAILPELIESMERHGHLELDEEIRRHVLRTSAATIDRLLKPIRSQAGSRKKKQRSSPKKSSQNIKVRTFADWDDLAPGHLEIDFVVHSGGSMSGSMIHSLVATDVCSGWVETIPLIAREQSLVVEALKVLNHQIPIPILGINSDNDSAFINDTLLTYCKDNQINFTRARPYHKNDQAWVEQKNGAVIRGFVGHARFSGVVACQTLAQLFHAVRLYVNFFQPSFKLREKKREGAKVKKSYFKPLTPCERLLNHPAVDEKIKAALMAHRLQLDPVELLRRIRNAQAALADLSCSESSANLGSDNLEQFLAKLPHLWRSGEARPTHQSAKDKIRSYRTREDPFVNVWPELLIWLQKEPDASAKVLFDRLQMKYPKSFNDGQLRTLQRRIKDWRKIMARKLVYAGLDGDLNGNEIFGIDVENSPIQ